MVRLLLDYGADPKIEGFGNKRTKPAALFALENDHYEVADFLDSLSKTEKNVSEN